MTLYGHRHHYTFSHISAVLSAQVDVCECGHSRLRPQLPDHACCGHCARGRHDLCGLGECCSCLVLS